MQYKNLDFSKHYIFYIRHLKVLLETWFHGRNWLETNASPPIHTENKTNFSQGLAFQGF